MAVIEELNRKSLHGYVPPLNLAKVYLGMGDSGRAMDYLEQAYSAHCQLVMLAQDGTHVGSFAKRAAIHRADEKAEPRKVTAYGAMLADIYGRFTEGFDLPDLIDAKALRDRLNA